MLLHLTGMEKYTNSNLILLYNNREKRLQRWFLNKQRVYAIYILMYKKMKKGKNLIMPKKLEKKAKKVLTKGG